MGKGRGPLGFQGRRFRAAGVDGIRHGGIFLGRLALASFQLGNGLAGFGQLLGVHLNFRQLCGMAFPVGLVPDM